MERQGALTDGSADCIENTQCAPSACVAHQECRWKGDDSLLKLGMAVVRNRSEIENTHVFFARTALLRLAAAAVKVQDKLATLGLDGGLAQPEETPIRAKKNIRYEFTHLHNPSPSFSRRLFGFSAFRPNQESVCNEVTAGKDALLVMPTGSGKSLC